LSLSLEKLPALLGAQPGAEMITALCDDRYAAHYPAAYLHAHHPLLVLRIDGHDPSQWPLSSDHSAMGPYLISHARFTPAFHILAHQDEPQIPWGVVRLDFNRESAVYAPIQPQGPTALSLQVQQGYAIAAQNCFRCHDRNGQGGRKAGRTWQSIARVSVSQPAYFDAYVLNPSQLEPSSQMAGSPQYDAATLAALRAYFRPFAETHP
jgi:mono/diheme cytochrome c family protein